MTAQRKRRGRKPGTVITSLAGYEGLIRGHCDRCAAANQAGFRRLIRELRASLKKGRR